MDNSENLTLDNLNNNQEFNFLNTLSNQDTNIQSPSDTDLLNDSPYSDIKLYCSYQDENEFVSKYNNLNEFSFMSFNIQSLAAKFSDFQEQIHFLQQHNCSPDVILLQEIWQIIDPVQFLIDGYHPLILSQRSSSQGGGVGIFIKDKFRFTINRQKSIFIDRILESLVIELYTTKNKKIVFCSLYRPPGNHPTLTHSEQFQKNLIFLQIC